MPSYLVEFEDGRKFRVKSKNPLTTEEATQYALGQVSAPAAPPDSGQGRVSSFASSVGRGAASIVPGVIGGAGYLTGSEALTGAAESIEAGINRALPVNPAYEDEFLMKAGQALGQVVPMIATGGAAGAVGKSMALARGLEAGAAAAKGTQLAGRVMLGSGMLQGARGGGQAAEQYGMEGGAAYARALLGGAIEGATEKLMFGMGTELSPIKKIIGDALDKGASSIAKAATIEGAEEGVAEIGGNLSTSLLAPSGVETPGMFSGVGEAAALGAVAGGAIGGFNAALGGETSPTVEGVPVVAPPAPIQEEERLDVESAVEKVITSIESEIATLTQEPGETGEAFMGRLNTQADQLAKNLETAATQTAAANVDVLPATAAALATTAPAPAPAPAPAQTPAPVAKAPAASAPVDRASSPAPNLPPRATEAVPPRPQRQGRDTATRDAWDEQYGNMRKGGRSHNDDGSPYQPTLLNEVMVDVIEALYGATDEEKLASIGDQGDASASTTVMRLLNDGWVWDAKAKKLVNPANPAETPLQGVVRIWKQRAPTVQEAPTPAQTPAPAPAPATETLEQARARLRQGLSAEERAEDEGILADVFAEERQRATAREDAQRRLRELNAERARLEQEIAAQEAPAPPSEPTPTVEETVPPEQPVPVVEEAPTPYSMEQARRQWIDEERTRNPSFAPDVESWLELQTPEDRAEYQEFEELRYKSMAGQRPDKGYKPYKLSAKEKTRLQDLASKFLPRLKTEVTDTRAVEEAPAPPITEDKFPETENVVAPAGEAEVGLGMEPTPFSPDDILVLRSPFMAADEEVSYRGPLGNTKSVIVSKRGIQSTVDTTWLRRKGETYTPVEAKPEAVEPETTEQPPVEKAPEVKIPKGKEDLAKALAGDEPKDYVLKKAWQGRVSKLMAMTKAELQSRWTDQQESDAKFKKQAERTRELIPQVRAIVDKAGTAWRRAIAEIAAENGFSNWSAMTENTKGEEVYRLSSRLAEKSEVVFQPRPTTPPTDAAPQREIPENRVQERQAPDEGGPTPEAGGRNRPVEGRQVEAKGEGQEVAKPGAEVETPVAGVPAEEASQKNLLLTSVERLKGASPTTGGDGVLKLVKGPLPKKAYVEAERLLTESLRSHLLEIDSNINVGQYKAKTAFNAQKTLAQRLASAAQFKLRYDESVERDFPEKDLLEEAKKEAQIVKAMASILAGEYQDFGFNPASSFSIKLDATSRVSDISKWLNEGTEALSKEFGSTNTVVTKETKDKAVKSLRKKIGGQTNIVGVIDPALLKDAVIVGTFYIEGGVRSFKDFSAKMIEEFGAGVQKYLRPAYDEIRKRTDIDTTGMDAEEGGEPAPKAPEPAAPPPPAEPPPPPAPAAAKPAPLEGPVSVANEPLNQVAEIIGLPRLETPLDGPYAWPQAWEDARAEFALNPERGRELVNGMIARPRPPTPLEEVILLREGVTRTNAFNAAVEAQSKATAATQEDANRRVADATNALAEIQQASALMGTLSGRALNFRKMSAWMDFSLANMVTRLQWGRQKELTKEEIKDAQDTHKEILKKEEAIAKTRASAGAEAELTSIFEETFKEAMALSKKNANDLIIQSRSAAKQGKSMKDFLVEKREEAKKRIRLRGNNLNMGLNPADLFDHAVIMASYIAEGVVSLADLTAKMVGDFGPNVEKHIPQIKKEADALSVAEQQVFETPEAGTTKSYAEQLVDSQGEDLSDRWVYNRVKEWLVEQGEAGLKKDTKVLLDEVFKVITKEVNAFDPSITEQQLRDMFSGYGKVKFPNPEAAAKKLRQMRRLELLLDKLERARAGVAPLRAGLQRDETTVEEREALKLLNQTMKDLDIPRAPSGANIKTPLDAVKSRLKNSIEDLNKQIKERKRAERPRKDVAYDEEAKALKTKRDNLQKQLDEIDPPRPPTVEERIQERLKDLDKQIANLKQRVKEKDFAPAQNQTPITEQIRAKMGERDALSQTLKEMRIEAEGMPVLTQEQVNERAQRNLSRQIDALEKQIKEQDFAPKGGLKPEETPEYRRLKTKVEALRKQRDQLKEDLGLRRKQKTDDELIDSAVASLEKMIDKLNKQINEGDLVSKARPSKVPEVAKVKNLRAERDSLREELQRLRKAKEDAAKDPVAEKIKADRKQLERMIKGYQERIAKGDFRKRPKIAKVYDDSLMQLEIDLDNLKAGWSRKVFEAHLASRPPLKRMLDTGGQVLNTSRAILTSFDLSAVLRQGGFIGLGNPFRAARNITPMLKAFASDDVAKASLKRLKQRDNWRKYVEAGLYIAETDQTKMSAQEEAFMSRWIDKIPSGAKGLFLGSVVRGSQRAYLTFLNNLRADTFDSLLNQLQKGPTPTREEMESIAYYINTATGRGDLGKGAWNQAAVGLNTIFFAPRLVASRFQIIGGMPIFKATGRTKALVLQEYAKFLAGASIVYALAGLAQDDDDEPLELDPRSSDFLKVRYGDTRVDPLGGLIQATVFVSRIVTGETKSAKGKITPIRDTMRLPNLFREVPKTDKVPYGGRNVFSLAADFARTKFSPAFGGAVDFATGENVIGEAVTPADVVLKMTVPMSFEEAMETLEAHGMPKGPALTVLMTFGAGVMTYNDRK